MTVGILGVAPIKIPDFDTEETARTQESSASGSTQESSAPGPQLAGSMSRTRTWVSVGVDAGFSELLETSPPSSLADSGHIWILQSKKLEKFTDWKHFAVKKLDI